jgi:1-deoxy-D-xylulose-5-phosphate reductoisomerase
MAAPTPRLDLAALGTLSFEPPDMLRFPALRLARNALRAGGGAPTVLNAANEVAVQGFLDRTIGFLDITRVVEEVLARFAHGPAATLTDDGDKRSGQGGAGRRRCLC